MAFMGSGMGKQHGGAREGAGRPSVARKKAPTSVALTPWVRDALAARNGSMSSLLEEAAIAHYKLTPAANVHDGETDGVNES